MFTFFQEWESEVDEVDGDESVDGDGKEGDGNENENEEGGDMIMEDGPSGEEGESEEPVPDPKRDVLAPETLPEGYVHCNTKGLMIKELVRPLFC